MIVGLKKETFNKLLDELHFSIPLVKGFMLVTCDGFVVASKIKNGVEDDDAAGVAAALINVSRLASEQLQSGDVESILVRTSSGWIAATLVSRELILLTIAGKEVILGQLQYELARVKDTLSKTWNNTLEEASNHP
ncbi:MAG TPA: hypothetical protein EYH45_06755 [Candidatus Caldiarchaeum subterraneum]|uniref:Roadblock/LAMTOR2 domain-containing protein n=1 Tax=Caldiarchaeum subterraneum TaxID=311458 RepID=A0A832ZXB4_CALS0|nr:hypothetical protein [Candidatus Caldarchaeum subterraneum]